MKRVLDSIMCIPSMMMALAIVAALAVSSIAYYGLWVLAIGTFLLAVYYTVKMM